MWRDAAWPWPRPPKKNPATSPRWFCFRVEDFSTYSVFFFGGGNGEHVFFQMGGRLKSTVTRS